MLNAHVRGTIPDYSPALDAPLQSRGLRTHFKITFAKHQNATSPKVYDQTRPRVMVGLFAGMLRSSVGWLDCRPRSFSIAWTSDATAGGSAGCGLRHAR
jgi:hypothetical protein